MLLTASLVRFSRNCRRQASLQFGYLGELEMLPQTSDHGSPCAHFRRCLSDLLLRPSTPKGNLSPPVLATQRTRRHLGSACCRCLLPSLFGPLHSLASATAAWQDQSSDDPHQRPGAESSAKPPCAGGAPREPLYTVEQGYVFGLKAGRKCNLRERQVILG